MTKAVILLNMGGINNAKEVEIFLTNMFNDKNIIRVKSDFLRSLIAKFIVFRRKNIVIENYKKIDGVSPLLKITEKLVDKLQKAMPDYLITYAMRYTAPFELEVLRECRDKNIEEIFLIPLYPQYSTTTTKSSFEAIERALNELNYSPKIERVDYFFDDEIYNSAIIENIKKEIKDFDSNEFDLIFSAHSLPQKIINDGDTYEKEVISNIDILKDLLDKNEIKFKNIHLAYQSKVTPVKWLEPSLESVLKSIDNKNVLIYPISFIIDNSETVLELSIEYAEIAKELGFENFLVSKCLNDSDTFVKSLENMVKKLENS